MWNESQMSFYLQVPDLVEYCRTELKIPDTTLISIEYEDLSDEGVKGWAIDSAEDGEYDIEIDRNLGQEETLMTVCHEMVHVSQMYHGKEIDEEEAVEKEKILLDGFNQFQAYQYELNV